MGMWVTIPIPMAATELEGAEWWVDKLKELVSNYYY